MPPPTRRARSITVMVVDDEETVLADTRQALEAFGITVLTARSTSEALLVVGSTTIDVALVDWRLADDDNGMALGRSLQREHGIPFVLFSGHLNTEATGHAYKQGAVDVVDKPLRPSRLLAAVEVALARRHGVARDVAATGAIEFGSDSISRRWASLALTACRSAKDPSTESAVAIAAGVSTSVFRKVCSGCAVGARNTRDLVRVLRALSRAQEDGSTLRSHLAISDPRTRQGLFQRAGLPIDSRFIPLRSFLLNQLFIPPAKECLRELGHLAANDPLFFVDGDTDRPHSRTKARLRTPA